MDGIRAYWDGVRLLSRQGKQLFAPLAFTKELPNISLDGELWMGRGSFERPVAAIKAKMTLSGMEWAITSLTFHLLVKFMKTD